MPALPARQIRRFPRWKYPGRRRFQEVLYLLAITLCDTIFFVLEALDHLCGINTRRVEQPSESDEWSEEEFFKHYDNCSGIEETYTPYGYGILRPCQDTVAKTCFNSEMLAQQLVYQRTTIPTPRIRRVIKISTSEVIVAMEYIQGKQLSKCWASLSWWSKLRVAITIRGYIRQLRRIRSPQPHPGPLRDKPICCDGPAWFGMTWIGPFTDGAALAAHYNRKRGPDRLREGETFDISEPFVLTHNDLSMRNFIMGTDGRLWMIDWEWAGCYPPWFEYLGFNFSAYTDWAPDSWRILIPFMAGPYFKQEEWMRSIKYSIYHG